MKKIVFTTVAALTLLAGACKKDQSQASGNDLSTSGTI